MNAFLKGQIINEIRNPDNTIKRHESASAEQLIVMSSGGRVLIEVLTGGNKRMLKIGGEEIAVDDKDFNEIVTELHICYASDMAQEEFQDKRHTASASIFRIKKEK